MRIYATTADLTGWTSQAAPANAESLLRAASLLVARTTRTARYTADGAGYPFEAEVRQAFRDATTAQTAFWAANGLDPAAGALKELGQGHVIGKSIKGASINKSVTLVEANSKARTRAVTQLCEEAHSVLDEAGLLNTPPQGY